MVRRAFSRCISSDPQEVYVCQSWPLRVWRTRRSFIVTCNILCPYIPNKWVWARVVPRRSARRQLPSPSIPCETKSCCRCDQCYAPVTNGPLGWGCRWRDCLCVSVTIVAVSPSRWLRIFPKRASTSRKEMTQGCRLKKKSATNFKSLQDETNKLTKKAPSITTRKEPF